MPACFIGLTLLMMFFTIRVFLTPDAIFVRHTTHPHQEKWQRWKWRCEGLFGTIEFGPHALMMRSTVFSPPQLDLYQVDHKEKDSFHGDFQSFDTRAVWGHFTLSTATRRMHVQVNESRLVCRATTPFTPQYGWYVDDTMDQLAVVSTKQRAAFFYLPSRMGAWVPYSSTAFDFLGNLVLGNVTLTRLT